MNLSKGNELLQELYERLNGLWYKQGKYKDTKTTNKDIKELINKIKEEYEKELENE